MFKIMHIGFINILKLTDLGIHKKYVDRKHRIAKDVTWLRILLDN